MSTHFIDRLTETLIHEAGIFSGRVDVERIARLKNAVIEYELHADESVSGMVFLRPDGKAVIGVNSKNTPQRQRFTIGHELGHLCLHSENHFHIDDKPLVLFRDQNSKTGTDLKEIEANYFAACLLMPEKFIRAAAKKHEGKDIEDVIRLLAKEFEVSIEAMAIRLSRLKLLGV